MFLGVAVATFFNGSNFVVVKENLTDLSMPVISRWSNGWHGLDSFVDPWNLIFGLAIFFLSRLLGNLYFINNVCCESLASRFRSQLIYDTVPFLIFFLSSVIRILIKEGFSVMPETQEVVMEPFIFLTKVMPIFLH